jgi:hypothetical protein
MFIRKIDELLVVERSWNYEGVNLGIKTVLLWNKAVFFLLLSRLVSSICLFLTTLKKRTLHATYRLTILTAVPSIITVIKPSPLLSSTSTWIPYNCIMFTAFNFKLANAFLWLLRYLPISAFCMLKKSLHFCMLMEVKETMPLVPSIL